MPVGPAILCPENVRKSTSSACTSTGMCGDRLRAVDGDQGAVRVGQSGNLGHRRNHAEHIGHVVHGDELRLRTQHAAVRVQVDHACVVRGNEAQTCPATLRQRLPGHQVAVMLDLGEQDLVVRRRCSRRPTRGRPC